MNRIFTAALICVSVALTTQVVTAQTPPERQLISNSAFAILPVALRVADTREGGSAERITLPDRPDWATAAFVNITITNTSASGYATAFDCINLPDTSNVNWNGSDTEANLAVVALSTEGDLCLHLSSPADVVVDLVAWADAATYYVLP
jgi:hypothetical protein